MGSCNTFREELAITNPLHGHALWEPDPGGLCDSVAVGHVGFIRDGCFYPLFNALSPPSDSDSQGPKYPPKLRPKNSPHIRTSTDNQQCFFSDNVTRVSSDSNPYTSGPDDEAPLTFSCSGKKGALLYFPLLSERHDAVFLGEFGEWILENIDACFKVAEYLRYGVERMEDIILVTGCHLAKSWVSATFSDSRGGSEVSFGVRVSQNFGVHFDKWNGRGLKLGPSGENLPQNQCIFVRGFRVTRRLNIWPKLRGAGPAPDFGEREPESDAGRCLELISIPADIDYQDPLHILSAHIAEQVPDCDMILVHDDDLQFIDDAADDSELIQDTQCRGPAIRQVQCILPGDETRPGPKAAINTVATLSKDVFEEQHEDRHSIEHPVYPHLMAFMSGSANVTSRPKSPEIVGPGSSCLRRSIPPVSQHGESMSNIADLTMTIPSQEGFTGSFGPPPDSSPKRPSNSASQKCLPPPLPRPIRELAWLEECDWGVPPCLLSPNPSIWMPPDVSSSPPAQKMLDKLPMIPNRHVGGEPEDSSDENPRQIETSENGRFATAIKTIKEAEDSEIQRLSFLSDCEGVLELGLRHLDLDLDFDLDFDIDLLLFAKEDETDGSGGFSSDTTRSGRVLSNRDNDDNKLYFRRFRPRRTAPEREPYSNRRFFSTIIPPVPLRGFIDRSDSNSRFRSSGRMELISPPNSFQAVSPIITIDFSNRTSDFLRRSSYWEGAWHITQSASADSLLSLEYLNSLLHLDFSLRTTQCTLVLRRRRTTPFAVLPLFLLYESHRGKWYTVPFDSLQSRLIWPLKRLFTDTDMHDPLSREEMEDFYFLLKMIERVEHLIILSNYDMVLDITLNEDNKMQWSYYYACHDTRCLFWLEKYDATYITSELDGVESPVHLKVCRHADCTTLQPPIFFVNRNSGVGFWLPDILQDRSHDPCERVNEAPLERRAASHLRIDVRSHENPGNNYVGRAPKNVEPGPTKAAFSNTYTHRATHLGQPAADNFCSL